MGHPEAPKKIDGAMEEKTAEQTCGKGTGQERQYLDKAVMGCSDHVINDQSRRSDGS